MIFPAYAIPFAFLITMLGSWSAQAIIKHGYRSMVVGFAAGAIITVAFLGLLPEALSSGIHPGNIFLAVILGFFVLDVAQRYLHVHVCNVDIDEGHSGHVHTFASPWIAALSMCGHSLMDGLLLGVAVLQDGPEGLAISLAVLAHRFCDGVNIVAATTHCAEKPNRKILWGNAVSPAIGFGLAFVFKPTVAVVPFILAFFAGTFLCLGATDLLPHSRQDRDARSMVAAWAGVIVMGLIVNLVH